MECTVLPTFLSKVRACTVGRRPDLRPRGAITVAGLCRNLTGFATTRRDWNCRGERSTRRDARRRPRRPDKPRGKRPPGTMAASPSSRQQSTAGGGHRSWWSHDGCVRSARVVVAVAAVGARRIDDARRGRSAVGAARLRRTAGRRSRRPRHGPPRARSPRSARAVVSAWIPCSTAMARCAASAWSSGIGGRRGGTAVGAARRSRSRPGRSGGSCSSARTTATASRLHAFDVARRLRLGARRRSATSSGARRSTRPATSIYETRVDRDEPRRPRRLAAAARRRGPATTGPRAAAGRRPLRADVLDRVHVGRRRRPARRPVVRRGRLPDAGPRPGDGAPAATVDDARARRSWSGSTATAGDLRRLPRPALPDRLDGRSRTGRARSLVDATAGRAVARRRRPTAPGSSTRSAGATGRRLRSIVARRTRRRPTSDRIPDGLELVAAAVALGSRDARCPPAGSCSPPTAGCRPTRQPRPPVAPPHPGRR